MVDNKVSDNDQSFVDDLEKGLKKFFKDVPHTYLFVPKDDSKNEIIVSWLNGPERVRVEMAVDDIYKKHDRELKEFKAKRFFDLKGAKFIEDKWDNTFYDRRYGHLGAVTHKEVEVPSSFSKNGVAYIPVFRDDYDGFMNDRDRRFWEIALNSVASVSEPDKAEPKMDRQVKRNGLDMS